MLLFFKMLRHEILALQGRLFGGLLGLGLIVFLIGIGVARSSSLMSFLPLLLSWIYAQRGKEKRERLWALMPVSRQSAGWLRAVIVVMPYILFAAWTWILWCVIPGAHRFIDGRFIGGLILGLLILFFVFFMIGDLVAGRPRREPGVVGWLLGLLVGAVFIAMAVTLSVHGREGTWGRVLGQAWAAIIQSPFFHQPGVWGWLSLIVFLFAAATVVSHGRRRCFME